MNNKTIIYKKIFVGLLLTIDVIFISSLIGLYIYKKWMPVITPGYILIQNQKIDTTIHIESIRIPKPGFIVIKSLKSVPHHIVASRGPLEPDTYEDFEMVIPQDSLQDVIPGSALVAKFYEDTDRDSNYDTDIDNQTMSINGKPIETEFQSIN